MMFILIALAIATGMGAAALLWPYGALVALMAAAVAASAVVFVAAVLLAYARAPAGDERSQRTNILTQLLGRQHRR